MRRAAGGSARVSAGVAGRIATAALACAIVAGAAPAHGQTISVSMSATPLMRVNSATAGAPPTQVVEVVGTYTATNDNSLRSLQARLSSAPPAGVTIELSLDTHPSATNLGWRTLTTAYQSLVTSFPRNTSGTYSLTYRVTATSAAGVTAALARTMTLRIQ